MRAGIFVLAGLSLACCAAISTTPLPPQPVDSSFVVDGFTWQSGGGIYVSLKAFEQDGRVAVCGLRAEQANRGDPSRDLNPLALQSMRITLNGETVFSDVAALPKTAWREKKAPRGEAECFLTENTWSQEYKGTKPVVKMARRSFKYYD